jgi:menaquinone-dependent protoporphyrinogen oxidase
MKIIIACSSKHGSTTEVGERISAVLRQRGHNVDLRDVSDVLEVHGYDAAVIGSATYWAKWRADAVRFLNRHSEDLSAMPVWLFSSGPIGEQVRENPIDLPLNMKLSHAQGHRLFGGQIDATELGPVERLVTTVLSVPSGDWRNWDQIEAWATDIHHALSSELFLAGALHERISR